MAKQLVGRQGKRRDAETAPIIRVWQTDIILNKQPGFRYQFFRKEEVASRLHPTRVQVMNWETGVPEVHDIPAWEIVQRDTGPEEAAGWRPDEGKPLDTTLTHGGGGTVHVCMRIPEEKWLILQRAQEHSADAFEERLRGGSRMEFNGYGEAQRASDEDRVRPGTIRVSQRFAYE